MPRLTNANREYFRERVNFYYWETACGVAQISRRLGISASSVNKLIGPKPKDTTVPRPTQYRY